MEYYVIIDDGKIVRTETPHGDDGGAQGDIRIFDSEEDAGETYEAEVGPRDFDVVSTEAVATIYEELGERGLL